MEIKSRAIIVKQRLHYHFAKTDGTWDVPEDMPFMREFLNEVKKLCDVISLHYRFKEHEPLSTPVVVCCFCDNKMTQREVEANVSIGTKEEDYMCVRCYRESNPEEYDKL